MMDPSALMTLKNANEKVLSALSLSTSARENKKINEEKSVYVYTQYKIFYRLTANYVLYFIHGLLP